MDALVLSVVASESTYGYKITQDVRSAMALSLIHLFPLYIVSYRRLVMRVNMTHNENTAGVQMKNVGFIRKADSPCLLYTSSAPVLREASPKSTFSLTIT